MPRFFFHVIGADTVLDPEGTELPSMAEARREALQDARALMSEAVLRGSDISGRRIEICNDAGEILFIVPFSEAVIRRE